LELGALGFDLQPRSISNSAFCEEDEFNLHEKCPFLLAMDVLEKEITNLASDFTQRKQYFVSTAIC
jgi:hypothetical protein